jgi:hypothetical protein
MISIRNRPHLLRPSGTDKGRRKRSNNRAFCIAEGFFWAVH